MGAALSWENRETVGKGIGLGTGKDRHHVPGFPIKLCLLNHFPSLPLQQVIFVVLFVNNEQLFHVSI